jgi:hypothetical protein
MRSTCSLLSRRFPLRLLLAGAALASAGAGPSLAAFAAPQVQTTYGGRAFAAFVDTSVSAGVTVVDTGPLPPGGGFRSNALLRIPANPILTADTLVAATSGASGVTMSSTSLYGVTALDGGFAELRAGFVRAEARVDCSGVSGRSDVGGLHFLGVNVLVTGTPNQTITIPGVARLVINEQTVVNNGSFHEMRVNALHLTVTGVAELIIGHAEARIDCQVTPQGPCCDVVTGGGEIEVPGCWASFGFTVGVRSSSSTPVGRFNYVDHHLGMHVRATRIDVYGEGAAPNQRHFEGICQIDGQAGFGFVIDVADVAEPGAFQDSLSIQLSNGYSAGGLLTQGNIQLHDGCP